MRLSAGDGVRVVDVHGQQVADVFAFTAADVDEYASAEHTRMHVNRLFPRPGESFVTNRRRPILRLQRDDSPGVHDMLCAACDPARYAALGAPAHRSCAVNLRSVMADLGFSRVEVPQPINLFMNVPVTGDGSLGLEPALTRPGDSVTLRAELDLLLVVSACPQDLVPINGEGPTDLELIPVS
jgi:uncharacterized protein YcgI (DUF1989 family)